MGLNAANFQWALKETFDEGERAQLVYKASKLLGVLPKSKKFGGKGVEVPLVYGDPQAIGPFANAQAAKTSTQTSGAQFFLTRKKKYGFITLDGEVIKASEGNDNSFLAARTQEVKGIFRSTSRDLSIDLARDGSGVLGSYASGTATQTITLQSIPDARNFAIGMYINLIQGGAVVGGANPTKVQLTGVDSMLGTLTIASSASFTAAFGVGALNAGDQFCRDGCFNACSEGIESYIPIANRAAKLAAAFYTVTRSAAPTQLGGVVIPFVAGKPIDEVAIDLLVAIGAEGGNPDYMTCNFENFGTLIKGLQGKKGYQVAPTKVMAKDSDNNEIANIGYSGVHITGPEGDVDLIPDNTIPANRLWALQLDTWKWRTLDEGPGFLDLDDNRFLREATSDGYELRIGYYGNLENSAPGYSGGAQI